jgi:single-stranded-DNA-specific exonuclease
MSSASAHPAPRRWLLAPCDAPAAISLGVALSVPFAVASLLIHRGFGSVKAARAFLCPSIEQLHDPYSLLGMETAVARIQQAVAAAEPILIYGDYDVDGTTAVVLLKTAIERLGGSVRFHVPHRLREGYGMQREVLEHAAADGVRLVISVDTGIRAFAAADAAKVLGLDLIVTDHHLPDGALPRALAVLNPNQSACTYACKGLCGAGVAFKLSQALLEASVAKDPEACARLRTKTLPSFLKMLAIATVADAVPLLDENRAIVALGLAALHEPASPGLRALLRVARLDPAKKRLTAMDIGFRVGPRINAAGRMDVASDVVELFTTRDTERAQMLAAKLDTLNTERRETEASAREAVMQMLLEPQFADARCLVLDGEGWHRGVIGILASRVVEKAGKPALVIAHENGEAYGSGRSIEGFHLLEALESCAHLFTRFGGHAHAVGFSLPSTAVPQLREQLRAYAAEHLPEEALSAPVHCDAALPLHEITPEFFKALLQLEPFGMSNPEPAFAAYNVRLLSEPRDIQERHIKLLLGQDGVSFAALGWHWAERVRLLALTTGDAVDLIYRLRENEHPEFGGLELEIVDLRRAMPEASPEATQADQ